MFLLFGYFWTFVLLRIDLSTHIYLIDAIGLKLDYKMSELF